MEYVILNYVKEDLFVDIVILSRLQFAITTLYHFLFIPLTLGLAFFIAVLETMYVKTDNAKYKEMAKFWGKLFILNFSMGVVTGIVQEFHFGMNWSEYSRFMGDIFGAPLALEALTAFFLESTFLGIWIFGWDRLNKKLHAACIWIVALASNLSGFWILVANSFMQHPVGYVINNGRAEMVDFIALITNSYVFGQFLHNFLASIVTTAFFILAISAYKVCKKADVEEFVLSLKMSLVLAAFGLLAVMGSGHLQAQQVARMQPMKLASVEALWETKNPAPFGIYAKINEAKQENDSEIGVPYLLSALVYNDIKGEVKGIKELQTISVEKYGAGNYIPDVTGLFWSFRIMILSGIVMAGIVFLSFVGWVRKTLFESKLLLRLLILALPLPYLANSTGWYVTEAGRQPWIVVGLQKVANAVSPNLAPIEINITLIGFTLIYAILAIVAVKVGFKFVKKGITSEGGAN